LVLRKRLKALGVQVEVLSLPQSLDSLREYMQQFLSLLGNTKEVHPLPDLIKSEVDAPRLLLLGANGVGTGAETLENEVLLRAGWRNYINSAGYSKLDLEKLITDPPDAVLWSAPISPALANMFVEHPALKKVMRDRAFQNTAFGHWQCPGPWTWQQIQSLTSLREQWQQK